MGMQSSWPSQRRFLIFKILNRCQWALKCSPVLLKKKKRSLKFLVFRPDYLKNPGRKTLTSALRICIEYLSVDPHTMLQTLTKYL